MRKITIETDEPIFSRGEIWIIVGYFGLAVGLLTAAVWKLVIYFGA